MKIYFVVSSLILVIAFPGCKYMTSGSHQVKLDNELDSVSYSLGLNVAKNIKNQGMDKINSDALVRAFQDVFNGKPTLVNDETSSRVLNIYFQNLQAVKTEKDKKAGQTFLDQNKIKAGVISLPSGLQYTILKAGNGQKPKLTDHVTVHYSGTTIDGKEFDSSVKRGKPVTFAVNEVIPGWQEALQLMPAGSKWRIFVPSDLAYGTRGSAPVIGPYATLIFEIELISVEK